MRAFSLFPTDNNMILVLIVRPDLMDPEMYHLHGRIYSPAELWPGRTAAELPNRKLLKHHNVAAFVEAFGVYEHGQDAPYRSLTSEPVEEDES